MTGDRPAPAAPTDSRNGGLRPLVVKIGGTVAADMECTALLLEELSAVGRPAVLVHGGGKTVSAMSTKLGMNPQFRDGIRITTPAEMEVVDMVLAGRVNTELVRLASGRNIPALGLTGADGGLLVGRILVPGDTDFEPDSVLDTRTARPHQVNLAVLKMALSAGYLPIVATVGIGEDGAAVNINADEAAQAIAEAMDGATLCYLSDIPGVLDATDTVIREIDPNTVESLITSGIARDGMAAKLRSCALAVQSGVGEVMIGQYLQRGDLKHLIHGDAGSAIRAVHRTG
ncbi:MAG TPA: acetylglutamate kinase [Alkalispirochaeta sp.]|nr:acetylglutamate kinase [Alkalispirochaeta sp.]